MNTNVNDHAQDGFELTLGRSILEESGPHDSLVHVWWRSDFADQRLVQIYLNRELIDVTIDTDQDEAWLIVDRTRTNRIELLAVRYDRLDLIWQPRPELLNGWTPPIHDTAEAKVLRDKALLVDTQVVVEVDGAVVDEQPLWSGGTPRSGFGGLFGIGEFGRDNAAGPGLGRGELGYGPLGTDADAWCWRSADLPTGMHTVTLTARDSRGFEAAPPQTLPNFTVEALPDAPSSIEIDSDFTLTWTS